MKDEGSEKFIYKVISRARSKLTGYEKSQEGTSNLI